MINDFYYSQDVNDILLSLLNKHLVTHYTLIKKKIINGMQLKVPEMMYNYGI
jgi:hypothetical protein